MSPESNKPKRKPPNAGKGRPKGSKNRRTLEVEQLADKVFDAAYVTALKSRIKRGKAPHMETFLAGHRWGLPKKTVAVEGEIPPFVLVVDEGDDDQSGTD